MSLRIGSAPVSFGVYGSTETFGVSPEALLSSAAAAGYSGMELGPPGFFGTPGATADAFARHELAAIGAYVPIHFSADDETVAQDLESMRRTLDELSVDPDVPGLAILADEGSPELLLNPARDPADRHLALDDAGWQRLVEGMERALALAEGAGVPTSFHPHISTYIESAWEVERLLDSTAVSLTLDTGHFQLAGADPVESFDRYGDRVNHVHLKDVRTRVLTQAKADGRADFDDWWADVAAPLGEGDVNLPAFLERLLQQGYEGWLVVEQDRLPLGHDPIEPVAAVQADNRRWLERALRQLTPEPVRPGEAVGV
jgi:inosose dehydratase